MFKNLAIRFIAIIMQYKVISAAVALVLIGSIVTVSMVVAKPNKEIVSEPEQTVFSNASSEDTVTSEETPSEVISSEETVTSQESSSSKPISSSSKTESKKPVSPSKPVVNTDYKYNTNTDIDNNIFLDAMVYTGYNIKKHRADGLMWKYVLASQKRGKGWLSKIGYGGGCTGYETKNGKPDIARFERGGLVCASYVAYVYFNYLPNVAGIDTSSLTKANKSYSANDWYIACKDWVKKGYSTTISFNAKLTSSNFINFTPKSQIPLGSLIFFCDSRNKRDYSSHVALYAGYKNGYHWVTHVGNENGPEFCAVERMHFGPDPQWPIAVITTPSNIRLAALLDIELKNNDGKAVEGAEFKLTNTAGKTTVLGKTDSKGKIVKDNLSYGKFTLNFTLPEGYTADSTQTQISLTTQNNSYNKIVFKCKKKPDEPVIEETPEPETPENPPSTEDTDDQNQG